MTRLLTAPVRAFGDAVLRVLDEFSIAWVGLRFGIWPEYDCAEDVL